MENRSKPLEEERYCAKVQSKGFCEKSVSQEKKHLQISNEQSSVVVISEMIQKELQKFYYVKKKKKSLLQLPRARCVPCHAEAARGSSGVVRRQKEGGGIIGKSLYCHLFRKELVRRGKQA